MDVFVILVFSEVLNDTKIYYNFFLLFSILSKKFYVTLSCFVNRKIFFVVYSLLYCFIKAFFVFKIFGHI